MTAPRCILPGQVDFVTRRCILGMRLLVPSKTLNQIIFYCLAHATKQTGVKVHGFVVMSNHIHILLTDCRGNLPEFMRIFDQLSARAINRYRGRKGSVWDKEPYDRRLIETWEDLLEVLGYLLVNPVRAGLVRHATDWPGLHSCEMTFGERLELERPSHLFRRDGSMPETISFSLSTLPFRGRRTKVQQLEAIRRAVKRREKEARAALRSRGRHRFLGKHRAQQQDPLYVPRPKKSSEVERHRSLTCDPETARGVHERTLAFLHAYRDAYERWRTDKTVQFPAGTYWLRVHARARCAPP